MSIPEMAMFHGQQMTSINHIHLIGSMYVWYIRLHLSFIVDFYGQIVG